MTVFEAKRISKKGYYFGIAGLVLGWMVSGFGVTGSVFLWAYGCWCLFHGVQLIRPVIQFLYDFGPVHLRPESIPALFVKSMQIRSLKLAAMLIGGYFLGFMGGAIIRQLYLWVVSLR